MKKYLHPTYYPTAVIVCACGNKMPTGSTQKEIHVEICSACHPFYTGKQKLVDTAGRVDKFKKRASVAKSKTLRHTSKRVKRAKKEAKRIKTEK